MKKSVLIAAVAVAFIGGSSFSYFTECGSFEQFNEGVTYTMTNYSEKGKVESTVDGKVSKVVAGVESTTATIDVVMKDGKGKESGTGSYELICKGNTYSMDMKNFITAQQKETYKDMDVKMEGDMLEYPPNMSAGMALPNGNMKMIVSDKGSVVTTITTNIKDRKCLAIETRTTPAGTWECYKISYTIEMLTNISGLNMPAMTRTTTEWFSFKVGAVRSESYRNAKLEGYSELTAFKKP